MKMRVVGSAWIVNHNYKPFKPLERRLFDHFAFGGKAAAVAGAIQGKGTLLLY
jgi:hypothetical protein